MATHKMSNFWRLSLVSLSVVCAGGAQAQVTNEPNWTQYNVPPVSSPPSDGRSAALTFRARADQWIEYLACGRENDFLQSTVDGNFVDDSLLVS